MKYIAFDNSKGASVWAEIVTEVDENHLVDRGNHIMKYVGTLLVKNMKSIEFSFGGSTELKEHDYGEQVRALGGEVVENGIIIDTDNFKNEDEFDDEIFLAILRGNGSLKPEMALRIGKDIIEKSMRE